MPPPLLQIPKSGAAIAAAADAEPQANAAAAPAEDGSGAPNGRTAQLFQQLSALFAAQRAAGAALGTAQHAESFAATRRGAAAPAGGLLRRPGRGLGAVRPRAARAQRGTRTAGCAQVGRFRLTRPAFGAPALGAWRLRARSYAYWNKEHYVRNLVAAEEGVFELIVRGGAARALR